MGSSRLGQAVLDGEQQAGAGQGVGRRLATGTGRDVEQVGCRASDRLVHRASDLDRSVGGHAHDGRRRHRQTAAGCRRCAGSAVSQVSVRCVAG
jgi:hypothetical protein